MPGFQPHPDAHSPVRVALVTRPAQGGIRTHVLNLAAGLDRTRAVPTLFAPADFLGPVTAPCPLVPITISRRPRLLADLLTGRRLAKLVAGFDLIHAHGVRGANNGMIAAGLSGHPAIITLHNVARHDRLARLYLASTCRRAVRVIAVSEAVAETAREAGVAAERVVVIPNGVDTAAYGSLNMVEARTRLGLPPTAPVIAAAGRLAPEKGFDLLMDAFPAVLAKCPGARLLIAGTGPEEAALRARARQAGGDAIMLLGWFDRIATLFAAADLVAVPSRSEGQGIVAIEAMAAGRPVVATAVGGLAETVVPGVTGVIVPPDSPGALAFGISDLLANPKAMLRMGMAGRARAAERFSLAAMLRAVESVYEDVAHGSPELRQHLPGL